MASISAPSLRRGPDTVAPSARASRAGLLLPAALAASGLLVVAAVVLALFGKPVGATISAALAITLPLACIALGALAGLAALRGAIHRANDGRLDAVRLPIVARPFATALASEYDSLVANLGSLFRDMEHAQTSIIAERNRHEAVLLGLPGALLVIDGDLRVTLSNRQAETLFGRAEGDLHGAGLFDLLHVDEADRNVLRDALLQERDVSNKVIGLRLGERVRQVALNLNFFHESPDEPQASAAFILQDITDWKKLEDSARHAEQLVAMGQLAAGVAHELNTPLGTILGYAKLLGGQGLAEAKRLEYAEVIHGETRRCAGIIDDLLAYARHDAVHTETCDANALIREVADAVAQCQGRRYCVPVTAEADGPLWVRGGAGQLDIVLVNLLVNAVQAASTSASPEVRIVTRAADGEAHISIIDNGPGVPADARPRIFEPFFTTKQSGEGTGLGLPICQSIISRLGGRVALDEQFSPGARFVVSLPLAQAPTP